MSLLAYQVNQLEVLDPILKMPLESTTWGRDISLRTDVTMSQDILSFQRAGFSAGGTQAAAGLPYSSNNSNARKRVALNGEKVANYFHMQDMEIAYTLFELERAQKLGLNLDVSYFEALQLNYQMGIDQLVYVGDTATSTTGLINSSVVTNVADASNPISSASTPDEILAAINELIGSVWSASISAVCPNKILLPFAAFNYIASAKVSDAGDKSILKYIKENSISNEQNGEPLKIATTKWCNDITANGRMVAYNDNVKYVRFPLAPIQRVSTEPKGIEFVTTYAWGTAATEVIYPTTVGYRDDINAA